MIGIVPAKNNLFIRISADAACRWRLFDQRFYSTSGDAYQYMQKSKLPTMHFQASLPRLPIPKLELTMQRFLAAVQPILSPEEFVQTQSMADDFLKNGTQLHQFVKEKDSLNKHTSYISEPWFNMYLSDRAPLPLNYNPLLVMQQETRREYADQIVRTTNLLISSLRFWRSLQAGTLEPEVYHMNPKKSDTDSFRKWMRIAPNAFATYAAYAFKAFPLDMSQYKHLFGTTRVPEPSKDRLVKNPDSRHVLVMRRGNLYAVDVMDEQGNILQPDVIYGRLKSVQKLDEKRPAAEYPIGVLTSMRRDSWAHLRKKIVSLKAKNQTLLDEDIDGALFCISLDAADEPTHRENDMAPLIKHLLAGKGTNRWFDKSVSLIVSSDGTAAVNFEHSWGDGVAVMRYFNEVYKESTERPFVSMQTSAVEEPSASNARQIRQLDFEIDDEVKAAVKAATAKNLETDNDLVINMLRYSDLNKAVCKGASISPDSLMQLSFQLAYKYAFNEYVGTYESCSTAAFLHGRTETMRPCTMSTRNFCEAMSKASDARPSKQELRAMMQECSTIHGKLTKDAAMGQGFDRHLFAMKIIAQEKNLPLPYLYNSKAYQKINYNIISTSTLATPALQAGSFGPVVPDGLGVGYSIQNTECGALVSSYKSKRDGKTFVDNLEKAFNDIHHVLSVQ